MQAVSLNTVNFILDFVVNVYRRCRAMQAVAMPLPQQADMKHQMDTAQSGVQQQIKSVSQLTDSLLSYKWSYGTVFELA